MLFHLKNFSLTLLVAVLVLFLLPVRILATVAFFAARAWCAGWEAGEILSDAISDAIADVHRESVRRRTLRHVRRGSNFK